MLPDLIAVLSHVVTDEVYDAEGELCNRSVGGAGAYAAVGASLASASGRTVLVSGVGSADRARIAGWLREREVDDAGLFVVGERSPVTEVRYRHDGERVEESSLGAEHFAAHTPLPRHLPMPLDRLAGCYLFHDVEDAYWRDVAGFRRMYRGPVLWEIAANACEPSNLPVVREFAGLVDVVSLNVAEARGLLGTDDPGEVARRLARPGTVVVLRRGGAGSVVVAEGAGWTVGVADGPVVDPTGGGNAYSGAFLAAYVRTGDPVDAARTAAAAAARVIAGPGAPVVDDRARERMRTDAAAVPVAPTGEAAT